MTNVDRVSTRVPTPRIRCGRSAVTSSERSCGPDARTDLAVIDAAARAESLVRVDAQRRRHRRPDRWRGAGPGVRRHPTVRTDAGADPGRAGG